MDRLRHIAPLLSLLLALIVAGEMTDVLPCVDEECGAWSTLLYPDLSPPVGGDYESGGSPAACLCHATFVSTARLPAAPAAALADDALWSATPGQAPAPTGRVPYPPPRG